MGRSGEMSHLAALERKIARVNQMNEREIHAIENAKRLKALVKKKEASTIDMAEKVSIIAMKLINDQVKDDVLPETLEKELSELKSTSDALVAHNQQLSNKQKEGIKKEADLNRLIEERFEVKVNLKSEVEEKTNAFNFVHEKIKSLEARGAQIQELHTRLLATAQQFKLLEFLN